MPRRNIAMLLLLVMFLLKIVIIITQVQCSSMIVEKSYGGEKEKGDAPTRKLNNEKGKNTYNRHLEKDNGNEFKGNDNKTTGNSVIHSNLVIVVDNKTNSTINGLNFKSNLNETVIKNDTIQTKTIANNNKNVGDSGNTTKRNIKDSLDINCPNYYLNHNDKNSNIGQRIDVDSQRQRHSNNKKPNDRTIVNRENCLKSRKSSGDRSTGRQDNFQLDQPENDNKNDDNLPNTSTSRSSKSNIIMEIYRKNTSVNVDKNDRFKDNYESYSALSQLNNNDTVQRTLAHSNEPKPEKVYESQHQRSSNNEIINLSAAKSRNESFQRRDHLESNLAKDPNHYMSPSKHSLITKMNTTGNDATFANDTDYNGEIRSNSSSNLSNAISPSSSDPNLFDFLFLSNSFTINKQQRKNSSNNNDKTNSNNIREYRIINQVKNQINGQIEKRNEWEQRIFLALLLEYYCTTNRNYSLSSRTNLNSLFSSKLPSLLSKLRKNTLEYYSSLLYWLNKGVCQIHIRSKQKRSIQEGDHEDQQQRQQQNGIDYHHSNSISDNNGYLMAPITTQHKQKNESHLNNNIIEPHLIETEDPKRIRKNEVSSKETNRKNLFIKELVSKNVGENEEGILNPINNNENTVNLSTISPTIVAKINLKLNLSSEIKLSRMGIVEKKNVSSSYMESSDIDSPVPVKLNHRRNNVDSRNIVIEKTTKTSTTVIQKDNYRDSESNINSATRDLKKLSLSATTIGNHSSSHNKDKDHKRENSKLTSILLLANVWQTSPNNNSVTRNWNIKHGTSTTLVGNIEKVEGRQKKRMSKSVNNNLSTTTTTIRPASITPFIDQTPYNNSNSITTTKTFSNNNTIGDDTTGTVMERVYGNNITANKPGATVSSNRQQEGIDVTFRNIRSDATTATVTTTNQSPSSETLSTRASTTVLLEQIINISSNDDFSMIFESSKMRNGRDKNESDGKEGQVLEGTHKILHQNLNKSLLLSVKNNMSSECSMSLTSDACHRSIPMSNGSLEENIKNDSNLQSLVQNTMDATEKNIDATTRTTVIGQKMSISYCLPEIDHQNNIIWPLTDSGILSVQPCPNNPKTYYGTMFRLCHSTAIWMDPDMTECRLSKLKELHYLVNQHSRKRLLDGLFLLVVELRNLITTMKIYNTLDHEESILILNSILNHIAEDHKIRFDRFDLNQQRTIVQFIQSVIIITDRLLEKINHSTHRNNELLMTGLIQLVTSIRTLMDNVLRAFILACQDGSFQHLHTIIRKDPFFPFTENLSIQLRYQRRDEPEKLITLISTNQTLNFENVCKALTSNGKSISEDKSFNSKLPSIENLYGMNDLDVAINEIWIKNLFEQIENRFVISDHLLLISLVPAVSIQVNFEVAPCFEVVFSILDKFSNNQPLFQTSTGNVQCSRLMIASYGKKLIWTSTIDSGCRTVTFNQSHIRCICQEPGLIAAVMIRSEKTNKIQSENDSNTMELSTLLKTSARHNMARIIRSSGFHMSPGTMAPSSHHILYDIVLYTSLIASVMFFSLTLIIQYKLRGYETRETYFIIRNLVLSLLLIQLTFLLGTTVHMDLFWIRVEQLSTGFEATAFSNRIKHILCLSVPIFLHFIHLASMFWMLSHTILLYQRMWRRIKVLNNKTSKKGKSHDKMNLNELGAFSHEYRRKFLKKLKSQPNVQQNGQHFGKSEAKKQNTCQSILQMIRKKFLSASIKSSSHHCSNFLQTKMFSGKKIFNENIDRKLPKTRVELSRSKSFSCLLNNFGHFLRTTFGTWNCAHYLFLSLGCPFLFVLISYLLNSKGYETKRYCWMSIEGGIQYSFIMPVLLLITLNTFLILVVLKRYFERKPFSHRTQIHQIRPSIRACIILLPFFCLNWFLGVLSLETLRTTPFELIFALTNGCHSFLAFYFHCYQRYNLKLYLLQYASIPKTFFNHKRISIFLNKYLSQICSWIWMRMNYLYDNEDSDNDGHNDGSSDEKKRKLSLLAEEQQPILQQHDIMKTEIPSAPEQNNNPTNIENSNRIGKNLTCCCSDGINCSYQCPAANVSEHHPEHTFADTSTSDSGFSLGLLNRSSSFPNLLSQTLLTRTTGTGLQGHDSPLIIPSSCHCCCCQPINTNDDDDGSNPGSLPGQQNRVQNSGFYSNHLSSPPLPLPSSSAQFHHYHYNSLNLANRKHFAQQQQQTCSLLAPQAQSLSFGNVMNTSFGSIDGKVQEQQQQKNRFKINADNGNDKLIPIGNDSANNEDNGASISTTMEDGRQSFIMSTYHNFPFKISEETIDKKSNFLPRNFNEPTDTNFVNINCRSDIKNNNDHLIMGNLKNCCYHHFDPSMKEASNENIENKLPPPLTKIDFSLQLNSPNIPDNLIIDDIDNEEDLIIVEIEDEEDESDEDDDDSEEMLESDYEHELAIS